MKEEMLKELDFQIKIQNEYIKGYQKLDFNTDTIERIANETIKMLEQLKLKVEGL